MSTLLVNHPAYRRHDTGPMHPECPRRMSAIMDHLLAKGLLDVLDQATPAPCDEPWLASAHTLGHVEHIRQACRDSVGSLDADTIVCEDSWEVARLAVGAALHACDAVVSGTHANAFCAIRPPGHHAEHNRAMGFCLFNNVAIAARYLQQRHGLQRIAIVDWDVHHGNGTQDIFYADPDVLYTSLHQYPYYPGTGAATETGSGPGRGATLNIPLAAGANDAVYRDAFRQTLLPALRRFQPQALLISAGFDAHRDDPLGAMHVSEDGFRAMTEQLLEVAADHCGGRLVSVLEGGYNLDALARSVRVHVETLLHA